MPSTLASRAPAGSGAGLRGAFLSLLLCLASGTAVGLSAQEPPDTVRLPVDSLPLTADSLAADSLIADSLVASGDTVVADSLAIDTIFYNLPEIGGDPPSGWAQGIWEWNAVDILAVGANTLVELVADVPGLVPVRGGDYGTPLGLTAFGVGGGGLRIFRDGFEVVPLDGSVPDLTRIGLGGIEHVRLERRMNQLVVHMRSRRFDQGQPYSLIEAGTGDLDTNVFRGTFSDPTAFGGSVALAIERADTRGPQGNEPGNRTGSWLRYQLHRADRAGVAVDFRRVGSETEVADYAAQVTRTDVTVRGRAELAPGITGGAYWGRSTHKVEDPDTVYAREGGSRGQLGLRLGVDRPGFVAEAAYRRFGGEDLPGQQFDLSAGVFRSDIGGVSAGWERAGWAGTSTSTSRVSAWTRPLVGLSLFGSWESGTSGARAFPLLDRVPPMDSTSAGGAEPDSTSSGEAEPEPPADPVFHVVDRTATRVGAQFALGGVVLSGALLNMEADSLLPFGLEFDRGGEPVVGGERSGWEVYGKLPLPILDGLHVEGSLQQWDGQSLRPVEEDPDAPQEPDDAVMAEADTPWTYLPERIYRGAFIYHKNLVASGNAELWFRLGVRGRDAMGVRQVEDRVVDEETGETRLTYGAVPFYQNWYGTLQLRVVTVRIFIGWENFTVRRDLQDVPGRILPRTRAFYGIRWTMLN